ncbi:FAD-dependent oxidoreductase [Geobacter sp. SVR]|uniref:FAD-dependent oxidoreductase n=1 Tax=Geobacter sp. SVR TaxID=2495594 RepID=UPI00143EFE17|nr:FAD-dependent oxidoreductase [Geobacter sp. SVR]BCS52118.1 hypothetical protein GSVR_04260 [Geobacter sp. SVR]GCF86573.1 hypothetical protein GSbR_31730 [Geobacter sp. SVR]
MSGKHIVIVGAGITGLSLAYHLSRDGHQVVLVEKENSVGGLARSFSYDGFVFDIGPHRFHTDIPEINSFIEEVLDVHLRRVLRKSGVYMFGTYFDWPLALRSMIGLPLGVLIRVAGDFFRKRNRESGNFEDYIVGRYGRTLYEIFFRPYTEKFLLMACRDISRDWAITGIDRAVIDKKAQFNDLLSLAKSLLGKKTPMRFIYPTGGGIQVFCDILREKFVSFRGRVITGATIGQIHRSGSAVSGVSIGGEILPCDDLVWTGGLNDLLFLLDEPSSNLRYLDMVVYNFRLKSSPLLDYQWCYYGADDIPFNRISLPTLFDPSLAPPGHGGLCVEVTCREGDDVWTQPQKRESAIRDYLVRTGGVACESDFVGCGIERIEKAYPVYSSGYRAELEQVRSRINRYENVRLLGRTGAFWYNNMDHSIEAALACHREMADKYGKN